MTPASILACSMVGFRRSKTPSNGRKSLRKAERTPGFVANLAGRVTLAWSDFVRDHFDDHTGLEPDVRHQDGVDACRSVIDLQLVCSFMDLTPFGIGETRAELGYRGEPVLF